jgi:hypothetical protein
MLYIKKFKNFLKERKFMIIIKKIKKIQDALCS